MIDEELLVRGLAADADRYPVPEDAVRQIAGQLQELPTHRRLPRPTPGMWLLGAAAAVVVLIIVAVAIGGRPSSSNSETAGGKSPSFGTTGSGGVTNAPAVAAPSGGGTDALSGQAATGSTAAGPTAAGAGAVAAPPPVTAGSGRAPASVPQAPSVAGAKVVKTGEMDLQVGKGQVAVTLDRLTGIATLVSGYVADSHTDEGVDPSGSVTLRVPAGSFESTVQRVRGLHVKVLSQQLSGTDVTGKYVDLQARIHALQATRTTFERILARATTIGDTLAVQSRITDVQTQIEELQGELRVLGDQADFGTLTVTVDQKPAAAPVVHHQSGMSRALHRSVDRFVNGIEAIVGVIGPVLLVVLIGAALLLGGRVGYRVLRRRLV